MKLPFKQIKGSNVISSIYLWFNFVSLQLDVKFCIDVRVTAVTVVTAVYTLGLWAGLLSVLYT